MNDAEIIYNPEDDETPQVQLDFERAYLDKEGVQGIGLGEDPIGNEAIIVYIQHEGVAKTLPKEFKGLLVITRTVGDIEAN